MEGLGEFGRFLMRGAKWLLWIFVLIAVAVIAPTRLWVRLDPQQILVVESPVSRSMTVYTSPGLKWRGFGTVTLYPKRFESGFGSLDHQNDRMNQSLPVYFSDGGRAQVSGSISCEMPQDEQQILRLHRGFGSAQGVDRQLVRPAVERAVMAAGQLMSSLESSTAKRVAFIRKIEDGTSFLKNYGIRSEGLSIREIGYDPAVKKQIETQQALDLQLQVAEAEAKKAELAEITAEKLGRAEAATARWAQEAIKVKAVVQAEQRLAVAQLDRQTAEQRVQTKLLLQSVDSTCRNPGVWKHAMLESLQAGATDE